MMEKQKHSPWIEQDNKMVPFSEHSVGLLFSYYSCTSFCHYGIISYINFTLVAHGLVGRG